VARLIQLLDEAEECGIGDNNPFLDGKFPTVDETSLLSPAFPICHSSPKRYLPSLHREAVQVPNRIFRRIGKPLRRFLKIP
jgi:hypothetical protein